MPEITLTEETWGRLQKRAEPLVDLPEDVIRRLLDATEEQHPRKAVIADDPINGSSQSVGSDPGGVRVVSPTGPSVGREPINQRPPHRRLGHGVKVQNYEFRGPILVVLQEMGGRGHAREVLKAVERRMSNRLSHVDYQILPSGQQKRWEKSANWERMNMVNDGLLRNDSRRGVWGLTEAGRAEARKIRREG